MFGPDGAAWFDRALYVRAGWSLRNARWADVESGGCHVFPDCTRVVRDLSGPVQRQVQRWRQLEHLGRVAG